LFSLSEAHPTNGSRCLRLELYPSPYPGVTPILRKNDWSEFRSLCFDIYNAEKRDVEIAVRIDDRKTWPDYSNRYNEIEKKEMGHILYRELYLTGSAQNGSSVIMARAWRIANHRGHP